MMYSGSALRLFWIHFYTLLLLLHSQGFLTLWAPLDRKEEEHVSLHCTICSFWRMDQPLTATQGVLWLIWCLASTNPWDKLSDRRGMLWGAVGCRGMWVIASGLDFCWTLTPTFKSCGRLPRHRLVIHLEDPWGPLCRFADVFAGRRSQPGKFGVKGISARCSFGTSNLFAWTGNADWSKQCAEPMYLLAQ